MLENAFQASVVKEIKKRLSGSIVMKTDASQKQGIPDLLILHNNKWAALECKKSADAKHQPNQDYYVSKMDSMSYARFINPENRKEILNELCETLES